MAMVNVTINGKKYTVPAGKTILEAVHEKNIDHIPNLCLEQQLMPYNSCYLCVVEVTGRKKLMPACSTTVQEGMEIHTRSSKVIEARKSSLELLLSNHFADCLAPCTMTCPAGVDIQGYLALTANGRYQEAVRLIKQTNPLPAVCGRVCTRPCELACRRNILDEKVGIDYVKRFVADFDLETALRHVKPELAPDNGKRVAIVGAGPAGLSAAYYLRIRGYSPVIFEAMPDAGGMLRYGIPTYRLPLDVLDKEIDTILELGVDLRTNMALGEDFTIKSLKDDGFDAVFLAMGAWGSRKLGAPGQESEGVLSGIKFLEEVGLGQPPKIYGKVVVVGGGNTAIDCARTSLRLGCDKVILLYRRTQREMPANAMEIEAAQHEGVEMHFLAAPVEVMAKDGHVNAIRCIRMELGEPDASGRRRPVPVPGSEFVLECDFVFAAIGQSPDVSVLARDDMNPENQNVKLTRWGSIQVNEETFETDIPGVFAGGDVVSGAATVIEAIAAGRKAAHAIDGYFQTGTAVPEPWHFNSRKDFFREVEKKDLRYQEEIPANPMPELKPDERTADFSEVELGFPEETAVNESRRCLECGCAALFECKLREYASEYRISLDRFKGSVNEYEIDRSHPLIELDPNKCILCSRCIRVCSDIVGASVYGFENRGFDTIVRPEMGAPLVDTGCISCGLCVETCPTGAIMDRLPLPKPGPWKLEKVSTTCSFCGVGCALTLNVLDDRLVKMSGGNKDMHTHGNHCAKGKFGVGFVESPDRLLKPAVKVDGELQPVDWNDALNTAAETVRRITSKYDGDSIACFVSPRLTNEEMYLVQKFARVVLRTHNISSINVLGEQLTYPGIFSDVIYPTIESSDVLLVALSYMRRDHTVIDFMIRKAINAGARVVFVGQEPQYSFPGSISMIVPEGQDALVFQGLMKACMESEGFSGETLDAGMEEMLKSLSPSEVEKETGVSWAQFIEAAKMLTHASQPVVVCDRNVAGVRHDGDVPALVALADFIGAGKAVIAQNNNSQGLMDICATGYFPGYLPIHDASVVKKFEQGWRARLAGIPEPSKDILDDLKNGVFKAVFIFGEDILTWDDGTLEAALSNAEFVMAGDIFPTKSTAVADIAVPLCTFAETSGTFTNGLRYVNRVNRAISPKTGLENWEIIVKLVESMGLRYKFNYSTVEDIQREMKQLIPIYRSIDFAHPGPDNIWDLSMVPEEVRKLHLKDIFPVKIKKMTHKSSAPTNTIARWFKNYWQPMKLKRW